MELTDLIAQAQDGRGIQTLSRQFNLTEAQTRAAMEQLAPAVMAGLRRETESPDGISGLIGALASGNHGRYLEGDDSGIVDDGNAILGHVFGSKDVSRGVAARAAEVSGVGSGILKQMLPVVAAMVMGALGKKMMGGTGGGLGAILGQILGGGAGAAPGGGDGGGMLGDVLGHVIGRGTSRASPASGGGGIADVLSSIFGGAAAPEVRSEASNRAGRAFREILGRNTPSGNAADQLLESLERAPQRT